MGVIYKLHQDVTDYIFVIKKKDPLLSCRKISVIISEKFKSKVSKSSINAVLKQARLSMPVGRRRKQKRNIFEAVGLGAFFLKAADCLTNVSVGFNEIVAQKLGVSLQDIAGKTDFLLYKQLFSDPQSRETLNQVSGLKAFVGSRIEVKEMDSYLEEIKQVMTLPAVLCQLITKSFQEIRCVKIRLIDGTYFLLDGRLSTIWQSAENIPFDFSVTYNEIKSYIKNIIAGKPVVLFMGPEKKQAMGEFFRFLMNLYSQGKNISNLALCNNSSQELEVIDFAGLHDKKMQVIFGLWPWQYGQYRKITYLEKFKFYRFEQIKKDFYIADVNVEFTQPIVNNSLILRGCALKNSLNEKVRLVILTNASVSELSSSDLVAAYLERWPNLEETYEDYNRKNELFFYTDAAKSTFSLGLLNVNLEPSLGLDMLFSYYLQALDLYAKWRFFPQGYRKKDFSTMNELFYQLPCQLKITKNKLLLTFIVPAEYPFLKDLSYACCRVNERGIVLKNAYRLFMEVLPRLIDNPIALNKL
ncbi:MAG: hypothetical protein WDL87_07885 [Candidatus Omnitrophota bacterium]|jgi:hypothetical protein